ncbi:lipoprotein-anchoring transpeptidase ErfK/SrfK [Gemmobacter caeni]|uniref:Lipoprotein-anchoring transpeptidase ErfK/SrfK n=2 Tax=Gemmobacter TaxID=204456 RepID=A0A2T6APL2_9RHOB|nr:lipoprotein-anchoring transpeptidase ErfK/SrfK [Gemmobacter caeni]TWI94067.1 lipoprotein-anchoring transpeptidase ErfK/SrfK [Gemmobacter caeni]
MRMVSSLRSRFLALIVLPLLAACAAPAAQQPAPQEAPPGYGAMVDEGITIPAVKPNQFIGSPPREDVAYNGPEAPGTIVVDAFARKLYLVEQGGMARRYSIAVGRAGLGFRGNATVNRKQKWPSWTPTANMIRTMPEFYAEYAGGLPGGLENPLGSRALYLYRGGRDTYFRIHGTIDNRSIGRATSAGCIRLFNQDIIDLYDRIPLGTTVKSRSREESERLEGKFMEDEWGLLIPYDASRLEEIAAKRAINEKKLEEQIAREAAEAAAEHQAGTLGQ